MDKLEALLKCALEAKSEPSERLNESIVQQARRKQNMKKQNIKRIPAIAALAITLLTASGGTIYATWHFLHPKDIATKVGDQKLTNAFKNENAFITNESKTENGYTVTMLGVVSGKNISDNLIKEDNGKILNDRSYIVTAFTKADGSALTQSQEDLDNKFYVSPYIKGQDPAKVNIYHMNGGYQAFMENGVYYQLIECNDLEVFAKNGVYLGVCDKALDEKNAFDFNETTGEITAKKQYKGLNLLFTVPMDKSKADEGAAQKKIKEWNQLWSETKHSSNSSDAKDSEADRWTPEAIKNKTTLVENSVKNLTPDAQGNVTYNWEAYGMRSEGTTLLPLDDYEVGVIHTTYIGYLDNGKALIETCTKNADGTVTMALYLEK